MRAQTRGGKAGAPSRRALTEGEALAILERTLGSRSKTPVPYGIGDDACVIPASSGALCWTIDASEEGAHYLMEWMTPEQVAHKALHAAVSDLAAMGVVPFGLLCHVTCTDQTDREFFERFAKGQARAATELACPILGGNLSAGTRFSVVTTALGKLPDPRRRPKKSPEVLTRSGARAGDEVWLVGRVGVARLGLLLLSSGVRSGRGGAAEALAAFRMPRALVQEGLALRGRASACMDVSDGLRRDAQTLSAASRVRVVLEAERIRALIPARFVALARRLAEDPLQVALEGGEDYALLATGPSPERPPCATVIGRVERGQGAYLESDERIAPLRGGFEHGR